MSIPTRIVTVGTVSMVAFLACYGLYSILHGSGGASSESFVEAHEGSTFVQTSQGMDSSEAARREEANRREMSQRLEAEAAQRLAEQQRQETVQRNLTAWKQLRSCDNRCERLSRESPIDYWESMRQGYGEIDMQGVDHEFVELVDSYRSLFLEYANTLREWNREREPLVDALNNAKTPESFAEGLVIGFAGGAAIGILEEIDKKYKGRISGLKSKLDAIQSLESELRASMSRKYGVSM